MIYHITDLKYFLSIQSSGRYISETYSQDGFIHCSTSDQVIRVANAYYPHQNDLILLEIDDNLLLDHLVYENLEGGKELFPHVYTFIPIGTIIRIAKLISSELGYVFPVSWLTNEEFVNMVK